MNVFYLRVLTTITFCLFCGTFSASSDTVSAVVTPVQTISEIIISSTEKTDLARIKFTIDKMIDPSVDVEASQKYIDVMVNTINAMAGKSATSFEKMQAVRKFIYKAGDWNDHRPFQYDHDDPFGLKISNKLMSNYISTRRGNCITMPFLFILLADRLGLDVTASTAPVHVFVKFTDDATGTTFNVETTSGANPARDSWYQQKMPMTETALKKGVYMQSLTRKETIVVMATVLVEHYLNQNRNEEAIAMADMLLKHYPKYAYLYTKIGTGYYHLLNQHFYKKYPTPKQIPKEMRSLYQYWSDQNYFSFVRAESLGWRPEGQVK